MADKKTILLLGLPASGKTTYVAALWHAVQNSLPHTGMTLETTPSTSEYLNKISGSWLRGEPVPRTKIGSTNLASMLLKDRATSSLIDFMFPDQAGEIFESLWSDRTYPQGFEKLIRDASGILLFLHPEYIEEPGRIDQANTLLKEIDPGAIAEPDVSQLKPWGPHLAPTQVKIVGLLQELLELRKSRPHTNERIHVALIISAWDLVQDQEPSVTDWVTKRTPLLSQFFSANSGQIALTAYGISAQGGKLEGESKQSLLDASAADRAFTVNEQSLRGKDLTEPLRWLAQQASS